MFIRSDNWNGIYVQYLLLEVEGNTETWTLSPANYLQPKLTFDNNPTPGSNNPVKSSGIYNMCPIIEDTRSSAVAAITGVAPFASLEDGQRIVLKLAYKTVNSTTLNLTLSDGTTTGAKDVYFANYFSGSTQVGLDNLRADSIIELVYISASSKWQMVGYGDFNTTYSTITQAEIDAGTSTSSRTVTPKFLCDNFSKHTGISSGTTSTSALSPNTMYNFGELALADYRTDPNDNTNTTASFEVPPLSSTGLISNAVNFYALYFTVGTGITSLSITLPTGVDADDTPTITAGDYVEILIINSKASVKVWTSGN